MSDDPSQAEIQHALETLQNVLQPSETLQFSDDGMIEYKQYFTHKQITAEELTEIISMRIVREQIKDALVEEHGPEIGDEDIDAFIDEFPDVVNTRDPYLYMNSAV